MGLGPYGAAALGAGISATGGLLGNLIGMERDKQMARLNYQYGEMAANEADKRTRALYNDLQSPAALLKQYGEAGLSPSLMYGQGGSAGASPSSGAQGSGASGLGATTYGLNLIEGAQLGLMKAQADKLNAEARQANANADTNEATREATVENLKKDLEVKMANIQNVNLKNSWQSMENIIEEVSMISKQQFGYAITQEQYNQLKETTRKLKGEADSALAKGEVDQETIDTQKAMVRAQLRNIILDNILKQAQGDMTDAQAKSLLAHIAIDWKNMEATRKQVDEQVNLWIKQQEKLGAEIPKTKSEMYAKWILGGLDSVAHVAEAVADFL